MKLRAALILSLLAAPLLASPLTGQEVRIKDLTVVEGAVPVRVVGYGLVVGLNGTGDRSLGGSTGASHTVRSIVNLLRRFDVVVPEEKLRARNVAAVLVTAELSPYARSGTKFDVQVSSVGDATSLKGGVLWMTPLVPDAGEASVGTAQGPLVMDEESGMRRVSTSRGRTSGSARLPGGGVVESSLPASALSESFVLALRTPDLETASRMVGAINTRFGNGVATIADPGAIRLTVPQDAGAPFEFLAGVEALTVRSDAANTIVVDSRTGLLASGGDIRVGPAAVSYNGLVLTISDAAPQGAGEQPMEGQVRIATNARLSDIVSALKSLGATPQDIAGILTALREAGAMRAALTIR